MNTENPMTIDNLWWHNEYDYQHEHYLKTTSRIKAIREELEETLAQLNTKEETV